MDPSPGTKRKRSLVDAKPDALSGEGDPTTPRTTRPGPSSPPTLHPSSSKSVDIISLLSDDEEEEEVQKTRKPPARSCPATSPKTRAGFKDTVKEFKFNPKAVYSPSKNGSTRNQVLEQVDLTEMDKQLYGELVQQPPSTDDKLGLQKVGVPLREPVLCKEQSDLVELICSGRNVFYTGSAGCGKSTVLKAFVKRLRDMGQHVDIIAPTGRAALDINGSTTWTYAGWTPDMHKKPLKKLKEKAHGVWVRKRLKATDVLVIDEISMVENLHFERLNAIMKEARNNAEAFGGVQLVVTGDFCQLPPVKPFQHCITCGKELQAKRDEESYTCPQHGAYYDRDKWAFRSAAWKECNFQHINLSQIHRQSDEVFIKILQKCRIGVKLLPKDTDLLLNHPCKTAGAIRLFSTREEVRRVNQENFDKLKTPKRTYLCLDDFKWNEKHGHLAFKEKRHPIDNSLIALADHRFDTRIELKQGMRVVLLVNLDITAGLVNGSQGIICGFEPYDPAKLPKAPDKLGKDNAIPGMAQLGEHAALKEAQIKAFIERAAIKEWPIVRFTSSITRTIFADCTMNELGDDPPYSLLSRTQIPLCAAYAMSIHKSQGMTLDRVVVNLSRSFEEGQVYVALSRARSLEGLQVEALGKMGHTGNPQVREFLWEKFRIGEPPQVV